MVAYAVFRQQCNDFIRLQAWYVWHVHVQRGLPRESIFGNHLVRFLYEPRGAAGEATWLALQDAVLDECRRHGDRTDTDDLEERTLLRVRRIVDEHYLADVLYARYQETYRKATPYCGFTSDLSGERLALHFTNTFDPDSPWRYPRELRCGLARLLAEARACHPAVSVVTCGTWLNSVPRFSGLFPATWLASAETAAPAGHGGWWGQFTDRTGALHRGNAQYLRQTGSFRFPYLRCSCPLNDLQAHLAGDPSNPPAEA